MHRFICLLAVLACACARSAPPPTTTTTTSSAPTSTVPSPNGPNVSPRTAKVRDGDLVFLELVDEPGPLMDFNAPLPPPGTPRATHPFLSGSCGGGRIDLCSRARKLLEASKSYDDFLKKLRDAGYTVEESIGR
jgi:hypothetical protein